MKRNLIILSTFVIGCLLAVYQSAMNFSSNPPSSYTGAPEEQSCLFCHSPTGNPSGMVEISFPNGTPAFYQPDSVYSLRVSVTGPGAKFGFQITAIDQQGKNMVGSFVPGVKSSVQSGFTQSGPRQYINHWMADSTKIWDFTWVAPTNPPGPVVFYVAGLAGDGNNSSSGDEVYFASLTLPDSPPPCLATPATTSMIQTGQRQVTYSWTSNPDAQEYEVQYTRSGWSNWFSIFLPDTETDYTATGLAFGEIYYAKIRSKCASGFWSDFTPTDSVTISCTYPDNASPVIIQKKAVRLAWDMVPGPASGYQIEGGMVGSPNYPILTIAGRQTTQRDVFGLTEGTAYQFRIRTVCGTGVFSDWSPWVNFATLSGSPRESADRFSNKLAVKMYPNPAKDFVRFSLEKEFGTASDGSLEKNWTVTIFDISGKTLMKQAFSLNADQSGQISLAGFQPGVYFVRLQSETESVHFRLVKE